MNFMLIEIAEKDSWNSLSKVICVIAFVYIHSSRTGMTPI